MPFQIDHHDHHAVPSARIPSLSTPPYRPLLLAGLQVYILYRHRATVCSRPAFACPCEGVYINTSFKTSSLLLQQCPACLVRLILIVFVMVSWWPYNCCFVGCCLQDLFSIARSILVELLSSFFSICLVSVHVVHPYSSINTTAPREKLRFILSVRSDFHMTGSLSIGVDAFASHVLMSGLVDEILLSR